MRILLIYPCTMPFNTIKVAWVPLSLSFIGSVLKKEGHLVSLFDRFALQAQTGKIRGQLNEAMIDHIQRFQPDLIGLNTISPLIHDAVETVNSIRKVFKGTLLAGGHHATALPKLTILKLPGLDGVVEGEGEMAMIDIAKGENPAMIPGVWWRKEDGEVTHTPPKQIENLDDLPFPALDLLNMAFYSKPSLNSIRGYYLSVLPMLTSRGCPYRCDFCCESITYGRGVRPHGLEYVIEWMKEILTDYRVEAIYFYDNDFLFDEVRAIEFCERMLSTGLSKKVRWAIQTRVNRIHPNILNLLRRAGCISIELGVESAQQNQLDHVHKATQVEISEKAIALSRREGISVHANMMTGFEGEKISDLEEGLRWLKRVKPNSFSWFPLMIHPGTRLYKNKGNGFFDRNEWTEENIARYYRSDSLSSVSAEERQQWTKRYLAPYQKWNFRWHIFRVNPPEKLVPLIQWRVNEAIKNFFASIRKILLFQSPLRPKRRKNDEFF
jgi:anaerobic magnesium-protoporphyrin IX monomethyl ester cyclase